MKNKKFILSRQNQKGQVAIFVALIFQVVFVFFAVLINVGLLVHHKINLQQSTDLAAYYGAMKQSELLNAISHVNFQMRQAWKLLTWRYRVLGTFGFQNTKGAVAPNALTFPLDISPNTGVATQFMNGAAEANKCSTSGANIIDIPFFCVTHAGMEGWVNANENNCRINCGQLKGTSDNIGAVQMTGGFDSQFTGGVAASVNLALNQANQNISDLCQAIGPKNFQVLSKFILAYAAEVENKKKLVQLLGSDLSADVDTAVDLDGGLIKTGSEKTFDNNLTEANKSGKLKFEVMNGLRSTDPDCAFKGSSSDGKEDSRQFLSEIKFQAIQFFLHNCTGGTGDDKAFLPQPLFSDPAMTIIPSNFFTGVPAAKQTEITNALRSVEYILGYEKNPWCQVYYAAKAQSEPKIPFLPLAKVKLSAVSVAKPFGGTIGPRYNSSWAQGDSFSNSGSKVDPTLPPKKVAGIPPAPSPLLAMAFLLPNYANYVGDTRGLKDAAVVASYQDLLLYHGVTGTSAGSVNVKYSQGNKANGDSGGNSKLNAAIKWPAFTSWNLLDSPSGTGYDYLSADIAASGSPANSFLRDLEIAVLAPNQFDLTYYSIDPDYYNNYYLKITNASTLSKLKSALGSNNITANEIRPDYGYNEVLSNNNSIDRGYSVRHQIAVASQIIKAANHRSQGSLVERRDLLKFIPDKVSSLLTGWTFQNFSDYSTFPNTGPDAQNTMTFGKCNDANWNMTSDTSPDKLYDTPVTSNLPPTPGNCVWGGRTGYSVKLVSPSLVRIGAPPQDYGSGGGAGPIRNPAVESFFTF